MSKNKILICDDDPQFERTLQEGLEGIPAVRAEFHVMRMLPNDLIKAVVALERRRKASRLNGPSANEFPQDDAQELDTAAILIIDYDLIDLSDDSYLDSGENIAYLARCYSGCGVIVALNQFERGEAVFDLTLKGHLESFADLNISHLHLNNSGLWIDEYTGFRPWSWPLLPAAYKRFEARVREVTSHLDARIFEYFNISDQEIATSPRSTLEFITRRDQVPKTTFTDFVTKSGNGLRGKDFAYCELSIARIAAARIAQWLEAIVLAGQNLLVDGPHLVSRYPSLVQGGSPNLEAWNKTASLAGYEETGISEVSIKGFRFQRNEWLSRPAWFWSRVNTCEAIPEVKEPWASTRPDYVFGEDVSRFLKSDEAREFVADLETPYVRRFVKKLSDIDYKPVVRFSL